MFDKEAEAIAKRCGILTKMQSLEADLMLIPDIVHVEFDLRHFSQTDHPIRQLMLLPKYSIRVDRDDYYEARQWQLERIASVCIAHDLHNSGDRIEDYGEHWYIVRNCGSSWPRVNLLRAYTVDDARREVRECLREGYGFDYIRIFLNDLARGKDITWQENQEIMLDLINGKFGDVDCSFGTLH